MILKKNLSLGFNTIEIVIAVLILAFLLIGFAGAYKHINIVSRTTNDYAFAMTCLQTECEFLKKNELYDKLNPNAIPPVTGVDPTTTAGRAAWETVAPNLSPPNNSRNGITYTTTATVQSTSLDSNSPYVLSVLIEVKWAYKNQNRSLSTLNYYTWHL